MDALSKLAGEHEKIRELAAQLEQAAAAGDAETATELTRRITNELNALAAVEAEVVYPAVVELAPELRPQVDEALGEHVVAKGLLYEARSSESLVGDAPDVPPETGLVTEAVEHHLRDEQLIESFRETAGEAKVQQLTEAVQEKTSALDEANAAGRAIKEQEEVDRAGETERTGGPDLSATAARVRNQ